MMKYLPLILIILSACQVKKEQTQNTDINRLHDIWALTEINGKEYTDDMASRRPLLEINVEEKRVNGNDGCNSMFGQLETLTLDSISFGAMGSTRMMCAKMEVPDAYAKGLAETTNYTLNELTLNLLNEKGKKLLVFKKVD